MGCEKGGEEGLVESRSREGFAGARVRVARDAGRRHRPFSCALLGYSYRGRPLTILSRPGEDYDPLPDININARNGWRTADER